VAKEIKFNIKLLVDGKEQMSSASASTKDLAKAFDSSRVSIRKANDALISFNQRVEQIRNVGESVRGIGEAFSRVGERLGAMSRDFAAVAQSSGLTGKSLSEARSKAQALADTFGGDLSEVLRSANALANGFGVSVQDALQLMQAGFVSGANVGGEFLDTLREYPRYFKEAGISAEEFIAIATNAAKQGIYSDKGIDTIKEGNLRIREMTTATARALEGIGISAEDVQRRLQAGTTTTFQVMQQVAEKLKELPASASVVGTAIADIFGGPGEDAGLEYIKSLADIETRMDKVREGADAYSQSLDRQVDAQAAFGMALSGVQEYIVGVYGKYRQLIDIGGSLLTLAGNTAITLAAVGVSFQKLASSAKLAAVAQGAWNAVAKFGRAVNIALGTSAHAAAAGAIALKMAVRGLMIATGVGVAITALTFAIEKLFGAFENDGIDDFQQSLRGAESAAQEMASTYRNSLGSTLSELQGKYKILQSQWAELKTEHEKTEWIKKCQSEFSALGLSVQDIKTAEDVFVSKTKQVAAAFNARAEAAAHAAVVADLYRKKFQLEQSIKDRDKGATATRQRRNYKAGDVISEDDPAIKTIRQKSRDLSYRNPNGAMGKGYYVLGAESAKAANAYYDGGKYRSTSEGAKAERKMLNEIVAEINEHSKAQAEAEKAASLALSELGTTKTEGTKGTATSTTRGVEAPVKSEIVGAASEADLKKNLSYYEEMRSKVENNVKVYAEWTEKILKARDALSALEGVEPNVVISRNFKKGAGKTSDKLKGSGGGGLLPSLDVSGALSTSVSGAEGLQDQLSQLQKKGGKAFDTLKAGWSGVQGIGDGIKGITDALSGQTDAWSALSAVVNGVIQIFEGFKVVIGIIKALTKAKKGETAASQAQTSANAGEAISSATAEGAKLAFPYNLIAIAAGVAAVIAALAMISSFATGGIVGGNSTSGDRVLARVNSGEMILNRRQQLNLLKMINAGSIAPRVAGVGNSGTDVRLNVGALRANMYDRPAARVEVVGKLRGYDIHLSGKNYERIHRA